MESSKKTQTIVGELRDIATKALLFIVAISFVLWGINGGSGLTDMDWVIKVDGVKFSYDQWRGLLHDTERAEDQEDQDGKHAVSGTKGSRSIVAATAEPAAQRFEIAGEAVDERRPAAHQAAGVAQHLRGKAAGVSRQAQRNGVADAAGRNVACGVRGALFGEQHQVGAGARCEVFDQRRRAQGAAADRS